MRADRKISVIRISAKNGAGIRPWVPFCRYFFLQGFFMWWVLMPVYVAASAAPVFPEGWKFIFVIVGLILFAIGFLFEALGDYQLWVFKRKPENAGKIMTAGLWKYTRHPNYFGEAVVWWGIALSVFPLSNGWLGLTAPILMTWLLTRVSGIPMLEEKYAGSADFQEYARKTPAFFPRLFPPK